MNITRFLPTIGIVTFVGLYLFSSSLYSGGSQANPQSVGFDWVHNYWCNLLSEQAVNGQPNLARPYAVIAMIILCSSMALFFNQFAGYLANNRLWSKIIHITGTLSMLFAVLIFTSLHDEMIILSSIFGFFTLIGIVKGLLANKLTEFVYTGWFCILLLGINNYIYYTKHGLITLPMLQKVTFVIILLWVVSLNVSLSRTKISQA